MNIKIITELGIFVFKYDDEISFSLAESVVILFLINVSNPNSTQNSLVDSISVLYEEKKE